jgi:transposase
LGTLSRHKIAALIGVAPMARESGRWKGQRRITGGRAMVRKVLSEALKNVALAGKADVASQVEALDSLMTHLAPEEPAGGAKQVA